MCGNGEQTERDRAQREAQDNDNMLCWPPKERQRLPEIPGGKVSRKNKKNSNDKEEKA